MVRGQPSGGAPGHREQGAPTGISTAQTDSESGTEGADSARRSLRALEVMRDRGLISGEEYDRRRAALSRGATA